MKCKVSSCSKSSSSGKMLLCQKAGKEEGVCSKMCYNKRSKQAEKKRNIAMVDLSKHSVGLVEGGF